MPNGEVYPLAEEPFWSLQGEGIRTGSPTIFIRLAGCNATPDFQCWDWCDTAWAREAGKLYSLQRIIDLLDNLPSANWICLTGGEPLIHNLGALIGCLKEQDYMIQVETNGTICQPDLSVDHWTVSPKGIPIDDYYLGVAKEFKWVIGNMADLERVNSPSFFRGVTCLQPENNNPEAIALCLEGLKKHPTWRLSLQTHKMIGVQ